MIPSGMLCSPDHRVHGGQRTLRLTDGPARLTVVNAVQLAMALVANVVLLLNLARKVRFTIAQPVTIVTW